MISYSVYGKGREKILVTHGWKTDHSCYDSILSSLDQETYTYVFIDQRGYGKSKDIEGPFTIEQVSADMIEVADHLNWRKFHIVGHSMGGKVIQRIMADIPARIKSAVGISPVPACPLPFDEDGFSFFAAADKDISTRLQIFRLSTGDRYTDTWYTTINAHSFTTSKTEAFREYLDAWVKYDMVDDINGCEIPIKVIVGKHDPDINLETMKGTYANWLKNLEIVELENCGHYPMFEAPLSLAAEIETFIYKHR